MMPANEQDITSHFPTAVFFYEQSPVSLIEAVRKFEQLDFDREKLSEHAMKFSVPVFKSSLRRYVEGIIKHV